MRAELIRRWDGQISSLNTKQNRSLPTTLLIKFILFSNMTLAQRKQRVSLEVSRSLHEKIKRLAKEREETMVTLIAGALHDFLETEHNIKLRTDLRSNAYQANEQYKFNWKLNSITKQFAQPPFTQLEKWTASSRSQIKRNYPYYCQMQCIKSWNYKPWAMTKASQR